MYLKSIEAHGFKSFANNTSLAFNSGITAIVGPNGSGKSNIADAVRWVLGEQKVKQLRSSSMQDVIFSGTENRKPQGYAYVSITLDNKDRKLNIDYDEVVVSRRLYRSGESEYMLNGSQVRLKDVAELFYDTGIGKEGYSIIGQGQIDKILSDKPDDRRELFDEAVGITKYKRRKAIAQKKLEEEQLNMTRVSDIIKELDRQVGPLKKQSENALNYLKIRDELILYESNYAVRELRSHENALKESENNLHIANNDLTSVQSEFDSLKEKYSQIDIDISNLDLEVASIKDEISSGNTKIENLKGQIGVYNEQINSENQTKENREARIKSLNDSIFEHIGNVENDLRVVDILKNQIKFIKENDKTNQMANSTIDDDLLKATNIIDSSIDNIKTVMGNDYNLDLNVSKDQIFDKDSFFGNVDEKRKEVENIDSSLEEIKNRIEELTLKNQDYTQKIKELNDNIINAQNEYHSNFSKLEALKNISERYEGYGSVIKTIMDKMGSDEKIHGVVADLINTDVKYEVCIETALGNTIQNIVTEDTDSAKNIIEYLKKEKLGRATFLPLSSVKPKYDDIYEKAKSEDGVIDIASNIVQFNDKYKNLVEYLLCRCLVVDNIDHAIAINKKYNQNLKIVTLQGELLNPGGSIAGGAYKNSSNLMGRKRELDLLEQNCEKLQNDIKNYTSEKEKLSHEYDAVFYDIEKLKSDISKLEIDKNTKILNIISEIKLEYSSISNKLDFTTQNLKRLESEIQNLFDEKCIVEDEDSNAISSIDEKNKIIEDLNKEIEEIKNQNTNHENIISQKSEEKAKLLSSRTEFFEQNEKMQTEIMNIQKEILHLENQIEKSTKFIQDISAHMYDDYQMTIKECEDKYTEELNDISDLKSLIKERQRLIKEMGPININAIEEYKGVSERYELLTTQYNDLIKSEEDLKGIVKELDDGMRKIFNENFKIIQDEFDRVFKELFGGGKAMLEIVDTENKDVLDAGIAIIAQPPGKKLQNMMQLSGGEKALTAIALLFAIQYLKPSPFCMLDEIEAALDEGNVDRFANYLHKLTDRTQFILITHRRGTMEKADRLYGITMQEKGVSTLVSVDLVSDDLK